MSESSPDAKNGAVAGGGSPTASSLPWVPATGAALAEEDLRLALRPAQLPLPFPRGPLGVAQRLRDLLGAGRPERALAMLHRTAQVQGTPAEEVALWSARGLVLDAADRPERAVEARAALLRAWQELGAADLAAALGGVYLDGLTAAPQSEGRDPSTDRGGWRGRAETDAASARGRRRGQVAISEDLRILARGLVEPFIRERLGPPVEAVRLEAALAALDRLRAGAAAAVPGVSEAVLRARSAQVLLALGRDADAARQALDALEVLEQEVDAAEADGHPETLAPTLAVRPALAARAVLARALLHDQPLAAAEQAVRALTAMGDVDNPTVRVALIDDLVTALMAAGRVSQATYAAGRLASLQRTLPREQDRTGALLTVAAQRLSVGRIEAADGALREVQRILREHPDRRTALTSARLTASARQQQRRPAEAAAAHREAARQARRLVDDLSTPVAERPGLFRLELGEESMALRQALDAQEWGRAERSAALILRRADPATGPGLLEAGQVWEHRVDAEVGAMLAAGLHAAGLHAEGLHAAADDAGGPADLEREPRLTARGEYGRRRLAALRLIDAVPAGQEQRAQYWSAYVDDRHAEMLERFDERARALRAARRARDAWVALGADADAARMTALMQRLQAEGHGGVSTGG
ncbi:hypothetical protein JSY14_05940 [Brachybacterium sp. EF45031]|uniref:hypothetical protein n=1 Tax=Brachybacterium sillae TaxID=2810536 RepID=UPI00217E33B1|nr:hypothetical protein [Brachybacterium sillae]MCS6711588.1 hypothetical protein [Brachybacterium sillae]